MGHPFHAHSHDRIDTGEGTQLGMAVAGTEVQQIGRIGLRSILGGLHQSFEEVAWMGQNHPSDMGSQHSHLRHMLKE
ncbi:hypothetical protein ANRL4_03976 [Anaerolineae bacterium]|nr:hypothetical protein ANRL4_03976 [Anaerolineae bacterium]